MSGYRAGSNRTGPIDVDELTRRGLADDGWRFLCEHSRGVIGKSRAALAAAQKILEGDVLSLTAEELVIGGKAIAHNRDRWLADWQHSGTAQDTNNVGPAENTDVSST